MNLLLSALFQPVLIIGFVTLPRLRSSTSRQRELSGVFGGGFDTLADQRFYSYRRDGSASGRFASLIWKS